MTEYRIIVETKKSGEKKYMIQRRRFLFWGYLRECTDISMYEYVIYFDSFTEAKNRVQQEVNREYSKEQSKIVKREVLYNF